jgi:hypothetical protein
MGRDSKSMMGTVGTIPVHWLVAVAFVYALALAPSTTLVAAAPSLIGHSLTAEARIQAQLPECQSVCGPGAVCAEECEYGTEWGWVFTTCGEYEDGYAGYPQQCNPVDWDDCSFVCPTESSST